MRRPLRTKDCWRAANMAAMLALLAMPVLAAEEGGAETWLGLPVSVWLWLNLILFWGAILYFLVPPVRSFLEQRRAEIHDSLVHAKEQRRDAQELKNSLEGRIDDLKREMNDLVKRAEQDGERERAAILAQAETERQRLVQQTEDEIELRMTQARQELTAHAAELASELARERLVSELSADERRRLFDEGLDRLSQENRSS